MARHFDQLLRYRHLRMIEALGRQGSLSAAARSLGHAQPALTKALRELEDMVGEQLFERHRWGVRPTAVGNLLLRHARHALADLRRFEDDLDQSDAEDGGIVTVGALPVAAIGLMPLLIMRVKMLHPNLQIRLVEGPSDRLLAALDAGEVDMVIGRLYPPLTPDSLVRTVLYEEPISVVGRADHPLHHMSSPSPADVNQYDFVLPTFSQRIAHDIEHFNACYGITPSARTIRSTSPGLIRELLLATDLLTIMPRLVLGGDLRRGDLKAVALWESPQSRPAGIVSHESRTWSWGARAVGEAVASVISQLAEEGVLAINNQHMSGGICDAVPSPRRLRLRSNK